MKSDIQQTLSVLLKLEAVVMTLLTSIPITKQMKTTLRTEKKMRMMKMTMMMIGNFLKSYARLIPQKFSKLFQNPMITFVT